MGVTQFLISQIKDLQEYIQDTVAGMLPDATYNDTTGILTPAPHFLIPPFSRQGDLSVMTGQHTWYNDTAYTLPLLNVRISVGTAPVGGPVVVDVNKNGTTIFTTQANRPTVSSGSVTKTDTSVPDITTLAPGDYLTVDIDVVGSSPTFGADLTVQVVTT